MNKRYILLTRTESKYDNFFRYHFKIFDSYIELQRHLLKFNNNPVYYIFEETNIKKDLSFKIKVRKIVDE